MEVYMEFSRVVGKNLKQEFYEGLDRHSPRLIKIFRSKRGRIGEQLSQLSQQTKSSEPTDIQTLVLRGLPAILGDDPANFFKACFDSDDEDSFSHLPVGILFVQHEGSAQPTDLHLSPASIEIIIEGKIVMDNVQDLLQAMCMLFGLMYALHLNYPKCMKLTF